MVILEFFAKYYPTVFVLACGITILVAYRNSWPLSFKILAIFVLGYVVGDTTANIVGFVTKKSNHYIYNFLYAVQFMVIPLFFYYHLTSKFLKKVIIYFFFVFPLFEILNTIWMQGPILHTFSYVLGGSFAMLLSVAYLWQLYISEETHSIFHDPVFWFSLAWLLIFAVTVPYIGMFNYLIQNFYELASKYYLLVFDITECIRSILLMIGFLCIAKKSS